MNQTYRKIKTNYKNAFKNHHVDDKIFKNLNSDNMFKKLNSVSERQQNYVLTPSEIYEDGLYNKMQSKHHRSVHNSPETFRKVTMLFFFF